MNKFKTISLAILGGINATVDMFLPILVAAIWIEVADTSGWYSGLIIGLGLLSSLFRAIKLGWFKHE